MIGADPADLRRRVGRLKQRLDDRHVDDPVVQAASAELAALAERVGVEAHRLDAERAALAVDRDRFAAERRQSRLLFDVAPEAAVITDANGIIRRCNPAAARLLGGPQNIGRPLVLRFESTDRARIHGLATSNERGKPADPAIVTVVGQGPARVRAEVRCAPAGEDELLWLVHDITAAEEARARLQEAVDRELGVVERLRELDEVRDAFVLAVSHDLQGPVAAIAGLAGLLVEQARLPVGDRRRMLEQIHSTASRLLCELRDLLAFERLYHGDVGLERRRVDVSSLVIAATDAADLGPRHVVIDAAATPADVDPEIVRRILDNLLANAARHTPPGTTVWVRLRREPDGILLVVEDDGPGVPDELRSHVFELFGRGRRVDDDVGLGVGLALVRQFAELHAGSARVEARQGGGASFQILLTEPEEPRQDEAVAQPTRRT